jgi:hypothetical protein
MMVIQVGKRASYDQVKLPATLSADGRSIIYTGGPGGWFREHSVVAVKLPQGWRSRVGYPLTVVAETDDKGRWQRVRDGVIPCGGVR